MPIAAAVPPGHGGAMPVRLRLPAILALALLLRVAATWRMSIAHPDEVFQYLEQAHRLVFGYGYVPWEYRDGMRPWALPMLLAAPMRVGALWSGGHLLLPRLCVAAATLSIVWAAWSLGRRTSPRHAWLAALVAATWYGQVYYAAHTLSETIATAAALPAFALLASARRLPLAGALLAAAAVARFHYAPALALVVLWRTGRDLAAWRALLLGALPVLALSALADWSMGQAPFGWLEANVRRNLIDGAANTYGVSGPLFYLGALSKDFGPAFMPVIFLAVLGARRQPQLFAAAALVVLLHSGIGHKEPRFILLAETPLVILAALGTADLVDAAAPRWRAALVAGAAAMWLTTSLALATTGERRFRWTAQGPATAAAAMAGRDPKLCGVATYGMRFWETGGYAVLHRDVPLYPLSAHDELGSPPIDPVGLAAVSPGFDALITTADTAAVAPPGFTRLRCWHATGGAACLFRRPGGCDPGVTAAWRLR